MINPALRNQSLARPLSVDEAALAEALEAVFKRGVHDFAEVARELQAAGVKRPGGDGDWSVEALISELEAINASLDQAYERDGIGA